MKTRWAWILAALILGAGDVRGNDGAVSNSGSASRVIFENAPPEVAVDSEKIISDVLQRFEEITRRKAWQNPIRICFVETLALKRVNNPGAAEVEEIEGVVRYQNNPMTIQILTDSTSSWERVFTSGLVHALTREAYGNKLNPVLEEGLAAYIAGKFFASEVSREMSRLSSGRQSISPLLRAQMEGHRFICQHIADKRFRAFFESEIGNPNHSYQDLKEAWKNQKTDELPANLQTRTSPEREDHPWK